MQITVLLDPISRTGIFSTDEEFSENLATEIGPYVNQFLYSLCLKGWTFLVGAKGKVPNTLDTATVELILRQQDEIRSKNQEASKASEEGPEPMDPSESDQPEINPDPNGTPEERRSHMFNSWLKKSS